MDPQKSFCDPRLGTTGIEHELLGEIDSTSIFAMAKLIKCNIKFGLLLLTIVLTHTETTLSRYSNDQIC